jgi:tRNA pseudouridine38-40 synthase
VKKIKLLLEYDGTAYQGWQIQKTGLTIQGILEEKIVKITGNKSSVIGASRTDAGVHALGQVAVFRTETNLPAERIKGALNALLPQDIRILDVFEVDNSFHPRNDVRRKSYFYIISNQKKPCAFVHKYALTVRQFLDFKSMGEASHILIGRYNFSSFMGAGSDIKDPVREIFSLDIEKLEEMNFMTACITGEFIRIRIDADGFLKHMARNIVGTLVEIGRGRIPPQHMEKILKSHDRKLAGPTAPAHGLFLEKIEY